MLDKYSFIIFPPKGYGDMNFDDDGDRYFGAFFVIIGVMFISVAVGIVIDYISQSREEDKPDEVPTANSLQDDINDLWADVRSSVGILVVTLLTGAVGFMYAEGLSFEKSFYWAAVTMTTVGIYN